MAEFFAVIGGIGIGICCFHYLIVEVFPDVVALLYSWIMGRNDIQ